MRGIGIQSQMERLAFDTDNPNITEGNIENMGSTEVCIEGGDCVEMCFL